MNNTISFQVNLLNELLKIRSGYFTSNTVVLDELVQNAQRAKASEINVYAETKGNMIRVIDNGIGCKDMNALITKSQSGWSAETIAAENAAGEGFLSTGLIANKVRFNSYVKLDFDFGKLFNEKSIDCIKVIEEYKECNPEYELSSEVILYELIVDLLDLINSWVDYAKCYLKIAPIDINIYMDGNLICKSGNQVQALIDECKNKNQHNFVVDNDDFMFISDIDSSKADLYYQGRYVNKVSQIDLGGSLIIKNSQIINVKLPDRKDYCTDDKFTTFLRGIFHPAMLPVIAEIHYEVFTEPIVWFLASCSIQSVMDIWEKKAIGYYYNENRDIYFSEVKKHCTYVDSIRHRQNQEAIVENNVYNGYDCYDINAAFRDILAWKFNVQMQSASFQGSKEVYSMITDYTTPALTKAFNELYDYLKKRVCYSGLITPTFKVGVFKTPEGNFTDWVGLHVASKNHIYINVKDDFSHVNLTTKTFAHQFMGLFLDTIIHELAHQIFQAKDGESAHYSGQVDLWRILHNSTDYFKLLKPNQYDWANTPLPEKNIKAPRAPKSNVNLMI